MQMTTLDGIVEESYRLVFDSQVDTCLQPMDDARLTKLHPRYSTKSIGESHTLRLKTRAQTGC
jgi:hypothetical protein